MRTYEFHWTNLLENIADATQFCAESKDEAYVLFKTFVEDEHLNYNTDITDITCEEVYNSDDAAEYGEEYLTVA